MKSISIRELHEKTGDWIRRAEQHGEIYVTDRGRMVARIVPHAGQAGKPYFSRRAVSRAFRRLMDQGKLRGGTDSTHGISADRDRVVS